MSFRQKLFLPVLSAGVVSAIFFATGCGKKETPATTASPPPAAVAPDPTGKPAAVPVAVKPPVASVAQADGSVDLGELQRTVVRWVVANKRRPSSFEDFAATAGVKIPPPPAGKKYFLSHDLHVQLVNQ